jgi:hypothetical protein
LPERDLVLPAYASLLAGPCKDCHFYRAGKCRILMGMRGATTLPAEVAFVPIEQTSLIEGELPRKAVVCDRRLAKKETPRKTVAPAAIPQVPGQLFMFG